MQRFVLHSKIHGARVTQADLNYVGSVTIDKDLLDAVDLFPNEKILIINVENGSRFESYVFEGVPGSGIIAMNGGAARMCQVGDRVLIMSFAAVDEHELRTHQPKVVFVDEGNTVGTLKHAAPERATPERATPDHLAEQSSGADAAPVRKG